MSFIIVLAALSLQYFLSLYSASYQVQWAEPYFHWMQKQFDVLTKGHGLFGVFTFVVPIVVVLSLIFTFAYHVFGYVGYLVLSLALLWYCLDLRPLQNKGASSEVLFLASYQSIFALLFWYYIFGPVGLAFYVVVKQLHGYVKSLAEQYPDLVKFAALTQGVLDWVPLRLVGLSFALVGHFGAVFKNWIKVLLQGVVTDQKSVVVWGDAALAGEAKEEGAARQLVFRALLVWLVAMALVSLGLWFG